MTIKQVGENFAKRAGANGEVVVMPTTEEHMPKWDSMREAVLGGASRIDEALDFAQEARRGHASIIDSVGTCGFVSAPTLIANKYGEAHIEHLWRMVCADSLKAWMAQGYTVQEMVWLDAEEQRLLQGGNLKVEEEQDRYVLTCDACGYGGRAKRAGFGGVTKKAYPWSWGKAGVPYSCVEQAIRWEVMPIEIQGYPIRINLLGEKPGEPDVHLFYKKPELIPEEYFARVGKTKTVRQACVHVRKLGVQSNADIV